MCWGRPDPPACAGRSVYGHQATHTYGGQQSVYVLFHTFVYVYIYIYIYKTMNYHGKKALLPVIIHDIILIIDKIMVTNY